MSLYKIILLKALLLSVTINSSGQQNAGMSDTIRFHKGTYYIKDLSFSKGYKLKPWLIQYEASKREFEKYNRNATPGGFFFLASVTSGVIALVKVNRQSHFFTPYSITQLTTGLIGGVFMIIANKYLKRSVKLYNERQLL